MNLEKTDWYRLYLIEDKLDLSECTKDDVKFLIELVYKLNGNVIDPRTHDKIQKMIDNLGGI